MTTIHDIHHDMTSHANKLLEIHRDIDSVIMCASFVKRKLKEQPQADEFGVVIPNMSNPDICLLQQLLDAIERLKREATGRE